MIDVLNKPDFLWAKDGQLSTLGCDPQYNWHCPECMQTSTLIAVTMVIVFMEIADSDNHRK